MDYETAADCWRQIEVSQLTEQRLEIVRAAINYSKRRVEWKLVWPEQRLEMGPARTAAHNAFIDACNTLGRNMVKAGESTRWRSHVGNEREELGDFACFIVLFIGLAAR